MKYSICFLTYLASVLAAPLPAEVARSVEHDDQVPQGCLPNHPDTFGLMVNGQVQAPTTTPKQGSTITRTSTLTLSILSCSGSNGQCSQTPPPATTSASKPSTTPCPAPSQPVQTMPAVSQIPDGQIQQPKTSQPAPQPSQPASKPSQPQPPKPVTTMPAVSQIPDGQIQQPKPSTPAPQPSRPVSTMPAISQIPDGQIQQPGPSSPPVKLSSSASPYPSSVKTSSSSSCPPPQPKTSSVATPSSKPCTVTVTSTPVKSSAVTTLPAVSVIKDGQPQAPSSRPSSLPHSTHSQLGACRNNSTLTLTLKDTVLTDSHGWTGYIAANRQFQFDGPPQAGALIVRGFSVCTNGSLALQGSTTFWECLSGNFYNLYDQRIGGQCRPITLNVAKLLDC